MPELKFTATGDVSGGVDALKKLQTELGKTAVDAVKLDSTVAKTSTALGTNLKTGANQATNAMTNLGRVIQDAPFGIIGISNNINPLLESFQRLKAETGTTGGAIKALAGSLVGGGGLGLAVSVITSLMTVFALNTRGAKSSVEDLSKSISLYDKAVKEAAGTTAKEVADVAVLVESFKKENLTRQEKINIIDKLQTIAPAYFANLDKEKTSVNQLTAAYDLYAASILRSVEIRVREGQLEKVIQRRIELQDKATRFTNIEVDANGKLLKSYNAIFDEQATGANTSFRNQLLTIKEQQELNNLLLTEKNLISAIANLKQPQDFIQKITANVDKIKVAKPVVDPRKYILSNKDLFGVDEPEFKAKIVVNLQPQFKIDAAGIDPALEQFKIDAEAAINATLTNIISDTISMTADAIGQALAGGQDVLPRLFDGIIKNIGSQIKELGKYLVKAGIEMLGAKKAIKALGITPQTAIIAGVALEVLGALLTSAAQKKANNVGFASGTRGVRESGFYNINERGVENIFLPRGTVVQPNNEVMAYGGGSQVFIPAITLRGADLVIAFNRASAQMNRNN